METIQDIEADETAKSEEWEPIQERLLKDIGLVEKSLEGLFGTITNSIIPRLENARQALNALKAEIQQLGH